MTKEKLNIIAAILISMAVGFIIMLGFALSGCKLQDPHRGYTGAIWYKNHGQYELIQGKEVGQTDSTYILLFDNGAKWPFPKDKVIWEK